MNRQFLMPLTIGLSLSGAVLAQQVDLSGRSFLDVARALKPGHYIWEPERSATGPLLVVVNLQTQRLLVFRDGIPIAASTVSSGKPGHETPTGVFTILQKNKDHYSKKYNNAPMPNMQRLTWSGIAMHAGNLPGYPASHGCVRLPHKFSGLLFGQTSVGMTVVITHHPDYPHAAADPDLTDEAPVNRAPLTNAAFEWNPDSAPNMNGDAIVSVVVSKADHRAIVMKGGKQIGSAPVYVHGNIAGAEAYVLESWDSKGPHWLKVHFSESGKGMKVGARESEHFDAPAKFRHALHSVLRPGSVVVVTPASLKSGMPGTHETVISELTS